MENHPAAIQRYADPRTGPLGNLRPKGTEKGFDIGPANVGAERIGEYLRKSAGVSGRQHLCTHL